MIIQWKQQYTIVYKQRCTTNENKVLVVWQSWHECGLFIVEPQPAAQNVGHMLYKFIHVQNAGTCLPRQSWLSGTWPKATARRASLPVIHFPMFNSTLGWVSIFYFYHIALRHSLSIVMRMKQSQRTFKSPRIPCMDWSAAGWETLTFMPHKVTDKLMKLTDKWIKIHMCGPFCNPRYNRSIFYTCRSFYWLMSEL